MRGLVPLLFGKAIAACQQEKPCKAKRLARSQVLRVATRGTTCTIACASHEPVLHGALLPLYVREQRCISRYSSPRARA